MNNLKDIILNLDIKPYVRKNRSSWLSDDRLKFIFDNTIGPFRSPDPVECFILYFLSKSTENNILEFGSWRGRSSSFLAQGIKDSEQVRRLHCIDWFEGDRTGGANPSYDVMVDRLQFFGLLDCVTIHNQNMLDFPYSSEITNIDLVFYDSDHNTEPTIKVLSYIHSLLNDNALVCLHDAKWDKTIKAIKGVSDLYHELVTFDVWHGFTVIQKKL